MANVFIQDSTMTAIANAIRAKGGTEDSLLPSAMPDAISAIETGGGDGDYLVQFIGYRGEVLQTGRYSTGNTVSVPADPSYDGLVFDGWSSPVTITDGTVTVTNQDFTIGAMFDTTSGATEIDITLTQVTGLTATIDLFNNVTSIDWGDGETSTALGSHTYSDYGDYTIKVYASGAMSAGTSESNLFGSASSSVPNHCCTDVRFSGVTTIGNYAFQLLSNLTSITIPDSVTSIGTWAFYACYNLANITIPDGVTSIGDYTFLNCYNLTSITIPGSVTSIGAWAFQLLYNLTSITIPDSVTSIGTSAFQSCYSLKSATIPDGMTSIGYSAFRACFNLKSVNIPDGVTSIGNFAFRQGYNLTSVTIPDSVTSISDYAFNDCYGITEYDLTAYTSTDTVPTLDSTNVFTGINGFCKMYFRDQATLDNFASATNWSTYSNYMYVKEVTA